RSGECSVTARVVSLNLHRRHLTAAQKRAVVAALLTEQPTRSNRAVAAAVGVDDKTVGAVRRDLEGRAEIPHGESRTDTKGRQQPASKPATERKTTEEREPEPAPAPARRFPHSGMLEAWIDRARGQTYVIDIPVEGGGLGGFDSILAERDKWDWEQVREQILPKMKGLRDALDGYIE